MDHIYQNIHGWFSHEHTYRDVARHIPPRSHIVEVGAWKGRSAAFMAVEIANTGKRVKFDVIDTWEGGPLHQRGQPYEDPYVVNGTLYEHFLDNMKYVSGFFNPIKMSSVQAATLYQDNSLDFILLDVSHDYENSRNDILAWLPKLKPGCLMVGDNFSRDWPGVIQAVTELLPDAKLSGGNWHYTWNYIKP